MLYLLLAAAVFLVLELAVRSFEPHENPPLHRIRTSRPYLYDLNPEHAEVNSLGLRRPQEMGPKADGEEHILLLGDSLTYGLFVDQTQTFAAQLEALFDENGKSVRVLNAGVSGYTPYNELKWLEREGAALEPDWVIAVLCMNDLVNPVAHWGDPDGHFRNTPAEAFPDYEEHVQQISPALYRERTALEQLFEKSALFRFLRSRKRLLDNRDVRYEKIDGRLWPVYTADESTQSIRVWTDPDSIEMRWLERMLKAMEVYSLSIGARFKVVLIPLAYQLEEDYPLSPGAGFEKLCRRAGLDCLDLLPVLKDAASENLFLGRHAHHLRDVWHLSPAGHRVTAAALYASLENAQASPNKTKLDVSL